MLGTLGQKLLLLLLQLLQLPLQPLQVERPAVLQQAPGEWVHVVEGDACQLPARQQSSDYMEGLMDSAGAKVSANLLSHTVLVKKRR